jgi:hypothetical protein
MSNTNPLSYISSRNGEKPLPHSEPSEKGLLCSLLLEPGRVMKRCANRISGRELLPNHRLVFDAISEWTKPEEKVDFTWLRQTLENSGQMQEAGGWEYVNSLFDFVLTAENADFYIKFVREAWCKREAMILGHELANGGDAVEICEKLKIVTDASVAEPRKIWIEVLAPSEIVAYKPPPGLLLVGDQHITRGSVFIIGGAPGVGKSRASVALAEAGATGYSWFGYKVHCKFKTLIVQNENGRFRLKREFSELDAETLDQYVRITPPPPYGLCFDNNEFRDQLSEIIEIFDPGVVIIGPWNAASRDEKARLSRGVRTNSPSHPGW